MPVTRPASILMPVTRVHAQPDLDFSLLEPSYQGLDQDGGSPASIAAFPLIGSICQRPNVRRGRKLDGHQRRGVLWVGPEAVAEYSGPARRDAGVRPQPRGLPTSGSASTACAAFG